MFWQAEGFFLHNLPSDKRIDSAQTLYAPLRSPVAVARSSYPPATKLTKLTDGRRSSSPYFALGVGGGRRRRPSSSTETARERTDDGAFAISRKVANSCSLNSTPFNRPTDSSQQARRKDLLAKKSVRFPLFTLPVRPSVRLAVRQSIHLQLAKVSPVAVHVRSPPSVSLSLRCTRLSLSLRMTSPDRVVQTHTRSRSPRPTTSYRKSLRTWSAVT